MSEKESLLSMIYASLIGLTVIKTSHVILGKKTNIDKTIYVYEIAQHELLKENADIDFVKKLLAKYI